MTINRLYWLAIVLLAGVYFYIDPEISIQSAVAAPSEEGSVDSLIPKIIEKEHDLGQTDFTPPPFIEKTKVVKAQKSNEQYLLDLIESERLCELLEEKTKMELTNEQLLQLLGQSLGDANFADLSFYLQKSKDKKTPRPHSIVAEIYRLSQELGIISGGTKRSTKGGAQGLDEEDQKALDKVEELRSSYPGNVFFSFLKIQIYKQYKKVPEETLAKLYDEVMAGDHYENPMFSQMRNLYEKSKGNLVQLHLASKVLKKDVRAHKSFLLSSVWFFGDGAHRNHFAELFDNYLNQNSFSEKLWGYEPGVYYAYRLTLPFEAYVHAPSLESFEEERVQPVYTLDELLLKNDAQCKASMVEELRIRLRAI